MRAILVLAAAVVVLLAVISIEGKTRTRWNQLNNEYTFEKYQSEFGKSYASEDEREMRRGMFNNKLVEIMRHNADETRTWKMGVNQFTDRTEAEFKKVLGLKKNLEPEFLKSMSPYIKHQPLKDSYNLEALPTHVDWRTKGIISAVKDQGECGSCWTFGTAETVEAHWAQKTGQLTDLSEQQILDCTPNPKQCGGSGGCNGGTAELAMARIVVLGGLTSEWMYPYTSYYGKNFQCQLNTSSGAGIRPFAKLSNFVKIAPNKYEPLMDTIANVGPLAVSVDASSWSTYETGVFNGCNQINPDIDHSVQCVGYGHDEKYKLDYWLVRNSWAPIWGEEGYIRLYRSPKETCGLDKSPSDGTGCKNGPPTVTVCGTCGIWYDSAYPIINA